MSDLKERFEQAVDKLGNAPEDGQFKPSNEYRLKMCALYRQANDGDMTGRNPGMLNPIARYKWQAWGQARGMSREDAMQHYIAEADNIEAQHG